MAIYCLNSKFIACTFLLLNLETNSYYSNSMKTHVNSFFPPYLAYRSDFIIGLRLTYYVTNQRFLQLHADAYQRQYIMS